MAPQLCIASADGSLGREIVTRLTVIGEEIRVALSSQVSTTIPINSSNVQSVTIDFLKNESIKNVLDGVKKLILIVPCVPQIDHYVTNLIECAKKTALEHLIFISLWGVERDTHNVIAEWYKAVERKIINSPLQYTIVRSNFFMQRLIDYVEPERNLINIPLADATVSFVDQRDVAVAVSEIAISSDKHHKKIYELTGQEALSVSQVAETFSEISGEKIIYHDIETKQMLNSIQFNKTETFLIDPLITYFNYLRSGQASKISSAYEGIMGFLPVTMLDFTRDYADTLREKLKSPLEAFNPQLWFS